MFPVQAIGDFVTNWSKWSAFNCSSERIIYLHMYTSAYFIHKGRIFSRRQYVSISTGKKYVWSILVDLLICFLWFLARSEKNQIIFTMPTYFNFKYIYNFLLLRVTKGCSCLFQKLRVLFRKALISSMAVFRFFLYDLFGKGYCVEKKTIPQTHPTKNPYKTLKKCMINKWTSNNFYTVFTYSSIVITC